MYHIHRIFLLGSLTLFMAGCGGDEPEPLSTAPTEEPSTRPVQPKFVMSTNRRKSDGPEASRIQLGGDKQRKDEPAEDALPPGVEPEDVFLTDAEQNTFTVAATHEELSTFTIVSKPDQGTDSGTFDLSAAPSKPPIEPQVNDYGTQARIAVTTGQSEDEETVKGLPKGFEVVAGSKKHEESGLPLRVRNKEDDSEFVLIPAGNSIRGSQDGPADTQPQHQVYLDSYYICVHEVTLRQWRLFREAERKNDRQRPTAVPLNDGAAPDMPVLGIPELEARKYAEWLHCDLPTEAQWEKAARGSQGFLYPWGNGRPIWSRPRDKHQILPVMSWRNDVSTYGVYDLAGNAREWTLDVYRDNWYGFIAGEQGEKLVENPSGPKTGPGAYDRVIRGGGDDWKVWYRDHARFSEKLPDVGFRLVINLKPEKQQEENSETEQSGRTKTSRR